MRSHISRQNAPIAFSKSSEVTLAQFGENLKVDEDTLMNNEKRPFGAMNTFLGAAKFGNA